MKNLTLLLLGLIMSLFSCVQKEKEKANLLFIITDQQRFDALEMVGNFPFLKTPNLDKLASQGVYFEHAYTQCAVCAPARASILTGCTIENHGVYTNYFDDTKHTPMKTFDEILVGNGYYTEYHGKFHDPTPMSSCYSELTRNKDYFKYLEKHYPAKAAKQGERIDPTFKQAYRMDPIDPMYGMAPDEKLIDGNGNPTVLIQPDQHGELLIPAELSVTAFQAGNAIKAIQRAKKSGKPFSITCSIYYPHSPILPTKPYHGMYSADEMPVAESIYDTSKNTPYLHTNGRQFLPEYADTIKIKYMMSNYFGLITEIDDWVGKLLETLKENGFEENTLVIFTSDHGEMLGSHGMREKNVFYEESARIPLLMRFPKKIKAGVEVNTQISNINIYATILDYLGIEKNESDGNSLRPLIENKKSDKFDFVVTEWNYNLKDNEPNYMILKGDWKMFIPYSPSSNVINVLYNLKNDPLEMDNLIGNNPEKAKYNDKANELKQDLLLWLTEKKSIHYKGVKERVL